jgi:hypothetical protein
MRPFLTLLLISLFLAPLESRAAEDEPLITKVIDVRPSIFGLLEPSAELGRERALSEEDKARIRPLADRPNGGKRYDVLKWLAESGIPERRGQVAVYMPSENALVFSGTAEDQDLALRVLEEVCLRQGPVKMLELNLSAWTYLDDPAALVNNHVKMFEQIREIAGESLRPIDSHLIVTRSGNRAESTQQLASGEEPPKSDKPPETPAALNAPGSIVEVEPVIGPDGKTIDFQVNYRARIPHSDGAQDLCFSHVTNATVVDGRNVIVQNLLFPPLAKQDPAKVRRCVVVMSARILSTKETEPPKLTPGEKEKRDQQVIADALKGLEKPKSKPADRDKPASKDTKAAPVIPAR